MAGVPRATWHYFGAPRPRVSDPLPPSARAYESRISAADTERIRELILRGEGAGLDVGGAA